MNSEDFSRNDLLRDLNPLLLLSALIALGLVWFGTWILRKKWATASTPLMGIGFILISGCFWITFQLLGQWFSLATSWSLIFLALIAGLAWEAILWIYDFEKSLVSVSKGRWLMSLRLLALVTIVTILLQPVRSFLENREINREIAILLDDSESMHLSDQRLSSSEILDRAQLFGHKTAIVNRPPLRAIRKQLEKIVMLISTEIDTITAAPSPLAGIKSRAKSLPEVFEQIAIEITQFETQIKETASESARDKITQFLATTEAVSENLKIAEESVMELDAKQYRTMLDQSIDQLEKMRLSLDELTTEMDQQVLNSMPPEQLREINQLALRPRVDLALHAAEKANGFLDTDPENPPTTLLKKLGDKYNLRYYRFNRDIEEVESLSAPRSNESESKAVRARTDLSGAVAHILENSSPESLAGILLFSDGRHNGANLPEDSLRQLAVQNSPLCAVPIGGKLGPVDSSILSLNAPESIYLDDRVVVRSIAKMDGLLGKRVRAQLITDEKIVDEQSIDVTDVTFRSEIRFVHTPEAKGIVNYQIRLEADDREIFKNNNTWDFKVAVTDDRTNVLLVDGYPRWEFRFLRNLFYGRDKSVHLQYVLLNPDTISGMRRPTPVAASASRKFGDAEATELPRGSAEWQLFDVIILGDVKPNELSSRDWKAIEEAVTKRGALLVCVAGPRHMPHDFNSEVLRNLLPITYTEKEGGSPKSPENAYKIALTASGKRHPITSQSTSSALNHQLWSEFPPLHWRWQSQSVKKGAEVLAYAEPLAGGPTTKFSASNASPDSIEAAIGKLSRQKDLENTDALITTMRSGLGKVVMMNFDRTWRFRYGVGDTYHHRFWGQMTRWGAGPNLRAGNEFVRLGTDRLSYTPSDEITVTAKILDTSRKPITNASVFANIIRNGHRIARQKLSYRSDTTGLYESSFPGFPEEGEYQLELEGNEITNALNADPRLQEIKTEWLIVTTRNPIELSELTADRDLLNRATRQTNGRIAELWELDTLLDSFGAPKETLTERRDITLWDKWPLFAAFLGFVTAEWILRRRSGLV